MTKIAILTYGCALNHSDSELMLGLLKEEGHKITSVKEAELIIINTCTVKNSAENKLYKALKEHQDKKIIIAGCIPQGEQTLKDTKLKDYTIIGTKQLINIPFAVEQTLIGNRIVILQREDNQRLNLPKIRQNETVEIIPINEGCLGSCTYCKTKHARGHITSYKESDIIEQTKQALNEGVTQIWLTSQDTGAYGEDTNTNINELLKKLLALKGDFMIRLGMINPNHVNQHLKGLIQNLNHDKMFKFIHLPIQAASNKVLKDMNRKYTYEEYEDVVKKLRKEVKDVRIATDIIVGFPTETNEDFNQTIKYVKEIKPEIINPSKYWKRPNTPAAKMPPLRTKEVKTRSIELDKIRKLQAKQEKEKYKDLEIEVLTEEHKDNQTIARTKNYIQVILKEKVKIGTWQKIKIKKVSEWNLFE